MLIPETKTEKEKAYLYRFHRWLESRPEKERPYYCDHGKYVGYKKALAYMCPECPET